MRYTPSGEVIPHEMRQEINDKIHYIVSNGLTEEDCGISNEDIFNAYTGIGGLHGLDYSNYNSYYAYKSDKQSIELGQFFTPHQVVEYIYKCLNIQYNDLVADLTCGHGAFANYCPNESNFYGNEYLTQTYNIAKRLYPNAKFTNEDIREYKTSVRFDFIVGNPPFGLRFNYTDSHKFYILHGHNFLKPAGIMAVIVPESTFSDEYNSLELATVNAKYNLLYEKHLDKDTFKKLGITNFKTKIVFLQKKSEHIEDGVGFPGNFEDISSPEAIYERYIKAANEARLREKNKIILEMAKTSDDDEEFSFKVKKLLYDIKRNPKINDSYIDCVMFLEKYKTQKKPEYMKYDEWEKVKLRKEDVIKHLTETLKRQNRKKNYDNRVVKTNYSIFCHGTEHTMYDLVTQYDAPAIYGYDKLLKRKMRQYQIQNIPFKDMPLNDDIRVWLENFSLYDGENTIKLNDVQRHDLNLFIQKQYHFIQWEQGSGKTFAGIAIGKHRLEYGNARNVFVVSTAIAIKNNWVDVLKQYGIDHIVLESADDVWKIKRGQFVLVTLNMMCKIHKTLKRYIKSISNKAHLIFDESDNMSNPASKRTKAVLNAFRRLKYKTVMTGTSTRNNIAEIYPQLELLYNNSYNMISYAEKVMKRNKDGGFDSEDNEYYLAPYPAYNSGMRLFTASHIPEKVTVFGVAQVTQDVLNASVLRDLLDKTIITRTFQQVTGKDLYEIKQVTCKMGDAEKSLYTTAIEEFHKLSYLFASTGDAKKDAMLKILNQLIMLLKICAAAQTIGEYRSKKVPEKFNTVCNLIAKHDERIAIGVRHVNVAKAYADEIQKRFPDREVFVIVGNEVNLKQRKAVVDKLKETTNGILISTQQSLSASMNIDFVDKCIIPELHWNNSSMSQYYFRFIRYTSTRFKTVYFVTYENSIESNLLKMVLVKDKLNLFMKNEDLNDEELYNRFGITETMLQNLMYKEQTEDGVRIRWGDQTVKG